MLLAAASMTFFEEHDQLLPAFVTEGNYLEAVPLTFLWELTFEGHNFSLYINHLENESH